MDGYALDRIRRRVGLGLAAIVGAGAFWVFSPGMPVLWGPRADASTKAAGAALFEHDWQPHDAMAKGDGLGPVFNGRSCVACHFQGGVGGGGGVKQNVRAFEAVPTKDRPEVAGGLVHLFAVENRFLENSEKLHRAFPIVPNGIRFSGGCQILTRDFDPVRTESVNTTALFGVGWIDRISGQAIAHQSLKASMASIGRELTADFTGCPPGRYRVLPDGRIGKFGWKAQFATLDEFVAAACANEIGLGNPMRDQARPIGFRDYPDVERDLSEAQFRALVAFVDTLDRPEERSPADLSGSARAERGKVVFASVGCAICHSPDLGGVRGLYSDFLLHRLEDREASGSSYGVTESPDVPLPVDHPKPDEWKTAPLWGVADSAPYFHDGSSPTLEAAILRHDGDAKGVTRRFTELRSDDRQALLAFLKTLRAPASAKPAHEPKHMGLPPVASAK